jgi:hypothetical protein
MLMDIQVGNISNAFCLNNNDPDKLNKVKVKIQLKNARSEVTVLHY